MTNLELIKTANVEEFAKLFGLYSLCHYIRMSDHCPCADFDDCDECLKHYLEAEVQENA